jgi:glycosyltransferase involved in cell wall biosynthesis
VRIGLHPLWLDSDPHGGIATYWSALIENLGGLDTDNDYVIYYTNALAAKLGESYRPAHFGARVLKPSSLWLEIPFSLPLDLWRSPVDLLHVQLLAPPICPVPFVQIINDIAWETNPEVFPRSVLLRLKLLVPGSARRARRIITVSEYSKTLICERYGIAPEMVAVTPHGVTDGYRPVTDSEALAAVRLRYGLERPFLLHVGKLQARKNLVRLIQAFRRGVVAAGLPHVLALVGPRTWTSEDIFRAIEDEQVQDRVIIVGEVPIGDLPALYSAADLFVFPSLAEGFGLPPLEAMSCGTAVISSSASSLPEVVGDAGIQIDPHDTNALAEAMVEVLRDDGLRESLVLHGLQRATLFSNERMTRLTMDVYKEVLSEFA